MKRLMACLLGAVLLGWGPAASGADLDRISINGYASFEFEQQTSAEGNGDPNGSFDADLFDLVFNIQVGDRIRAAADVTWEHGPASEDNFGNVALEYGFIEYSFSDLAKVRVGKMFTPYGIFNEIHTAKPAFLAVKEPASTNKPERIVEGGFRFFPRWGAGIALRGDGVLAGRDFNYDVFVANGVQEEVNPFEEDMNTAKSITGRFRFEPNMDFQIGTSFYYDKLPEGRHQSVTSNGYQFRYQRDEIRLLGEIVVGWLKYQQGGTRTQVGWFVQPSYHFDNGITPYLRFEGIDPDTSKDADQGYDLIVGVNFEVVANFMIKVENNYFWGADESSLAEFPGNGYNEIKAAVVLGF